MQKQGAERPQGGKGEWCLGSKTCWAGAAWRHAANAIPVALQRRQALVPGRWGERTPDGKGKRDALLLAKPPSVPAAGRAETLANVTAGAGEATPPMARAGVEKRGGKRAPSAEKPKGKKSHK